jgi:hypothetical protein
METTSELQAPKKISLQNVVDMIIETYDPKILDNPIITPEDIKQAFYELAETENALGGPRKVLAELISNHKNGVQKPIPEFIGGPFSLTCHWSEEYKKMIYIFGEYHTNKADCSEFPNMLVEDFIYELIDKTDVFIDIFLEVNSMKRKQKEYDSYDGISNSRSISQLFNKLKKCIQYNTRHDNACRLARVNYVDVRRINNNQYNDFYNYISNIYFMSFHHDEYIYKLVKDYDDYKITQEELDQLEETKIKETFDKIKNIIIELNKKSNFFYYLTNDNVENFWLDRLYNNEYVKHELKKITDRELYEKITDFFEQTIRTFVYSNKQKWIDNIDIILDTKTNMIDYLSSVNIVFEPCHTLLYSIVDMYTICRMFKDFDLEKKPYEGADDKDQPKRANNIIIYTGDSHSICYRQFLDKMQFKKISAKSQSETCIDLRNFPLPFFSMSAINNYYIGKDEDEIIQKLDEEGRHLINLSHTDSIDQGDAFEQLDNLVTKYIFYIKNFKIHGIKLGDQFSVFKDELKTLVMFTSLF